MSGSRGLTSKSIVPGSVDLFGFLAMAACLSTFSAGLHSLDDQPIGRALDDPQIRASVSRLDDETVLLVGPGSRLRDEAIVRPGSKDFCRSVRADLQTLPGPA